MTNIVTETLNDKYSYRNFEVWIWTLSSLYKLIQCSFQSPQGNFTASEETTISEKRQLLGVSWTVAMELWIRLIILQLRSCAVKNKAQTIPSSNPLVYGTFHAQTWRLYPKLVAGRNSNCPPCMNQHNVSKTFTFLKLVSSNMNSQKFHRKKKSKMYLPAHECYAVFQKNHHDLVP